MQELRRQLNLLHQQKIIEFSPQSDAAQLVWTQPRRDRELLGLDWAGIRKRAALRRQKLESSIAYAQSQRCRMQDLLAYFGEKAEPCGKCDRCVESQPKTSGSPEALEKMCLKIESILRRESLFPNELLEAFDQRHHPLVREALHILVLESRIHDNKGKLAIT